MTDPVDRISWLQAKTLTANGWNPNVVMSRELKLLELSIVESGWIQPILISKDLQVIDGFHRWRLSLESKALQAKYQGKVPCVVMEIETWESILLTVRINRAKGSHLAVRMAGLVKKVIDDHGVDEATVAEGIGATLKEVNMLYRDSIFEERKLKDYKYSKAWVPEETTLTGPAK